MKYGVPGRTPGPVFSEIFSSSDTTLRALMTDFGTITLGGRRTHIPIPRPLRDPNLGMEREGRGTNLGTGPLKRVERKLRGKEFPPPVLSCVVRRGPLGRNTGPSDGTSRTYTHPRTETPSNRTRGTGQDRRGSTLKDCRRLSPNRGTGRRTSFYKTQKQTQDPEGH